MDRVHRGGGDPDAVPAMREGRANRTETDVALVRHDADGLAGPGEFTGERALLRRRHQRDLVAGDLEIGAAVEGIDVPLVLEALSLQHPASGPGLIAFAADQVPGFRGKQRGVERLAREQRGHELLRVLAEEIRLLVGEVDEPPAQVVPEEVVAVGRDRPHHLGDDPLAELPLVQAHVVEADHRQESAELLRVSAVAGREDEPAHLRGPRDVFTEGEHDLRRALLEIVAPELAAGDVEVDVRVSGPRHAGDDRAGPDHVAGVEVLEHEHEVALARFGGLSTEALAAADHLRRDDVAVGRKVDEVDHPRELEKRGDVFGRDLSDDEHA